jgi:hypothetical protein
VRTLRASAYWMALLFSTGLLLLVLFSLVATYLDNGPHADLWAQRKLMLFVGAVAIFSGVFFGWRRERMDVQALELKGRDLEIRLRDAQSRLVRAIVSKGQQSGNDVQPTKDTMDSARLPRSPPSLQPEQSQEPSHDRPSGLSVHLTSSMGRNFASAGVLDQPLAATSKCGDGSVSPVNIVSDQKHLELAVGEGFADASHSSGASEASTGAVASSSSPARSSKRQRRRKRNARSRS